MKNISCSSSRAHNSVAELSFLEDISLKQSLSKCILTVKLEEGRFYFVQQTYTFIIDVGVS